MRTAGVGTGLAAIGLMLGMAAASPAAAQLPEEFKNLKVLPEDIDQRELVGIMRGFAGALGVRCWHCHVGEEGKPLSTFDFATDEKQDKRIARDMMKMVKEINGTIGKMDTEHDPTLKVACATCHHGLKRPQAIKDILIETYEGEGLDAAAARYRELREKYYGGYAYDFGQGPLNTFAEFLGGKGEMDAALEVQRMNAELHPDEPYVMLSIGQIHQRMGNKEKAVEAFEKVLEMDPSNDFAKRLLEQVKGG